MERSEMITVDIFKKKTTTQKRQREVTHKKNHKFYLPSGQVKALVFQPPPRVEKGSLGGIRFNRNIWDDFEKKDMRVRRS